MLWIVKTNFFYSLVRAKLYVKASFFEKRLYFIISVNSTVCIDASLLGDESDYQSKWSII